MIYARIAGTGSCLPGNPVSNDDLVARGITSARRLGIEGGSNGGRGDQGSGNEGASHGVGCCHASRH